MTVPSDLEPRPFLTGLFAAFNDHDVDRIVALHRLDAVLEEPSLPAPATGQEAIAAHLRAIFRAFPDLHFDEDLELYTGEPGKAAAAWRFAGTMTGPMEPPGFSPTGRRATIAGVCCYAFEGDLLARHRIVYDALGLLEQLGIVPSPASASGRIAVGLQRATTRVTRGLRRAS